MLEYYKRVTVKQNKTTQIDKSNQIYNNNRRMLNLIPNSKYILYKKDTHENIVNVGTKIS